LRICLFYPWLLGLSAVRYFTGHMSYCGLRKLMKVIGANVATGAICTNLYRVS
jgi:hypothetical protein